MAYKGLAEFPPVMLVGQNIRYLLYYVVKNHVSRGNHVSRVHQFYRGNPLLSRQLYRGNYCVERILRSAEIRQWE